MDVGFTCTEPVSVVNAPTPWSISTEVAFVVVHCRVALCPANNDSGNAVIVTVGLAEVTVTVTGRVFVAPFAAVAVRMYVVVCVGTTVAEPEIGNSVPSSSSPTLGEMLTERAPVVFHVKVVNCPLLTEAGLAVNVAASWLVFSLEEAPLVDPQPAGPRVARIRTRRRTNAEELDRRFIGHLLLPVVIRSSRSELVRFLTHQRDNRRQLP